MAGSDWAIFGWMAAMLGVLAATLFVLVNRMDSQRSELLGEIRSVRDHLDDQIGGVRGEIAGLRGEIGGVRDHLDDQIGGVRGEIGALRQELRGDIREVRTAFADLDRRLTTAGG